MYLQHADRFSAVPDSVRVTSAFPPNHGLHEEIPRIDFLLDDGEKVIPLEVKAEENLNAKSLKSFVSKYQLPFGIRTSMSDYRSQEKLVNLPLYAISELWHVCDNR